MTISRLNIDPLLPALERGAVILVPNNRLRDAFVATHDMRVREDVFHTPAVYAVDVWLREMWDLCAHSGIAPMCDYRILSAAEEQFIWAGIIGGSLVEYPLLNPEETARAVNQSYRDLKQWLPGNSVARLKGFSELADVSAFIKWINQYHKICVEQSLLSLVDAIEKQLDTHTPDWLSSPLLPKEVVLVNFFETPPLYQQLFATLGNAIKVTEQQLLDPVAAKTQLRTSFVDRKSELLACATWAKAQRTANPDHHIGIIYSEDFLSQPALQQMFNSALNDTPPLVDAAAPIYNSSGSRQSLLDAACIYDGLLLLNLNNEQQQSLDLCRLLQSPYLLAANSEQEARIQTDLAMRRHFTATANMTDFIWHLNQIKRATYSPKLAEALLTVRTRARQLPASALARDWAQHFTAWLQAFGWPGDALNNTEVAIYKQWQEVLNDFSRSSHVLGALGFREAISHLKALCSQQSLPNTFSPQLTLSVYSIAESSGLRFDQVWLVGFSDQSWPPSARPSPFIPYALQQEAQIPGCHSDVQFQRSKQQFNILKQSISQTFIASHYLSDGELNFSASSFIADFPERVPVEITGSDPNEASSSSSPLSLININDPAGFALQHQESVQGGQSIISNQSSCPFRAFAMHRLQVKPLEGFAPGLSPRDRGSALHTALENLFATIDSSAKLQSLDRSAKQSLVDTAATHAVEFLSRKHRELMTPRFRELERHRIANLLQRFLELENERESFQVIAREQEVTWMHGNLELRLKIDRIDELNDNSLLLLDYKSGKLATGSTNWIKERPEDMQLPLYYTVTADAQSKAVSALALANVNVENITYSGISASDNVHTVIATKNKKAKIEIDWPAITAQWQKSVRQRAQEFIEGHAQVSPVNGKNTCRNCNIDALCRIQELDTTDPDEESDYENEAEAAS